MISNVISLPIILPLFFAILTIAFHSKSKKIIRTINLIGAISLLASSIWIIVLVYDYKILTLYVGSWLAPFGIALMADFLSSAMLLISSIIFFTTSIYSLNFIDEEREKLFYYPMLQILMMGVNGSFLTNDIFNLYVWYEVMLISSFVLISLGGTKEQFEGGIKYVTINLLASTFFLVSIAFIYGIYGSLNMTDIAFKVKSSDNDFLNYSISFLLLTSFGVKSALFPLFFWLPASYHVAPISISSIFAGLLTKVGVYSIIRVFTLIFNAKLDILFSTIILLSALTMLIGVFGAASQMDIRRILSFHIISQIGYMTIGLGILTQLSLAAAIFYVIHHIIVKTNLFYVAGIVDKLQNNFHLRKLGYIYKNHPMIGLLFLIPAFSLAGIPPLSGFWAKFLIIKSAFNANYYFYGSIALFVGILTLFSMIKIWNEAFWKKNSQALSEDYCLSLSYTQKFIILLPSIILAAITLLIGLFPEFFFKFADEASRQLLNQNFYFEKILGKL
jgi:multicomponent Na+:H+ antiporter subunit D